MNSSLLWQYRKQSIYFSLDTWLPKFNSGTYLTNLIWFVPISCQGMIAPSTSNMKSFCPVVYLLPRNCLYSSVSRTTLTGGIFVWSIHWRQPPGHSKTASLGNTSWCFWWFPGIDYIEEQFFPSLHNVSIKSCWENRKTITSCIIYCHNAFTAAIRMRQDINKSVGQPKTKMDLRSIVWKTLNLNRYFASRLWLTDELGAICQHFSLRLCRCNKMIINVWRIQDPEPI